MAAAELLVLIYTLLDSINRCTDLSNLIHIKIKCLKVDEVFTCLVHYPLQFLLEQIG
jgi:hypothetical protein